MKRMVFVTLIASTCFGACGSGSSSDDNQPQGGTNPTGTSTTDASEEVSELNPLDDGFISNNCLQSPVLVIDRTSGKPKAPVGQSRELVKTAIDSFPRLLCDAVTAISIEPLAGGLRGEVRKSSADIVRIQSRIASEAYLNAEVDFEALDLPENLASNERRAALVRTVIHEAAHSATYLLDDIIDPEPFVDKWQLGDRKIAANEAISNTLLRDRLTTYWGELHNNFVNENRASTYTSAWRDTYAGDDARVILENGFFRAYGAKDPYEDIATYVGEFHYLIYWAE